MSNISHNSSSSSALEYSNSSHSSQIISNHRITQSLQYLDRVRSINKKIFDSKKKNPDKTTQIISPLEKLINSQKDITYIDNQKIYGIIKIQILEKLKQRVDQLEEQQQKGKVTEHELEMKFIDVNKELISLKQREVQLNQALKKLQNSLKQEKQQNQKAMQKTSQLHTSLYQLTSEKIQDSRQILGLRSSIKQLEIKALSKSQNQSSHLMICQTQTQFWKPSLQIAPFEANIEDILMKLREKEGQKISRPTLKQIISQSLDTFVKELDTQYKLIHEQTIDLTNLRQKNQYLLEQNQNLKKTLEDIRIEQEKLKIFRNCMTQFLNDTSENVSKSIEAQRVRKRIYQQLSQHEKKMMIQDISSIQVEESSIQQSKQLKTMKEGYQFLKKQNLNLLKTLGEYQYKWKNIERVLDQNKKQDIPDDGTVGHLVKMSKLVKESIKNLLQEL